MFKFLIPFLLVANLAGAQALPIDSIAPPWNSHRDAAEVASNITLGISIAHGTWKNCIRAEDRVRGCLHEGAAIGATLLITEAIKRLVQRERPNGVDHYSFWSGHTAVAAATSCSDGRWAFLIPATGYFRIASDWHYFTDTLAGAAAGCIVSHYAR